MAEEGLDPYLQVTEVFHSIQGESSWAGHPCVFVRLTGCPLRCVWCDTSYSFQGGTRMSLEEVLRRVAAYDCPLVEVTGGEPLAQRPTRVLLSRLVEAGYRVLLETSGALPIRGIDPGVHIVMDWKCPDSGESRRNLRENLAALKADDELKFVLLTRRDYEWAREQVRAAEPGALRNVLFSPVWGGLEPAQLADWILQDRLDVRLQIQLHKVIFGADARGV